MIKEHTSDRIYRHYDHHDHNDEHSREAEIVTEFLDDYCKKQCEKYDGRIRIMYEEWLKTDWDYIIATCCDVE